MITRVLANLFAAVVFAWCVWAVAAAYGVGVAALLVVAVAALTVAGELRMRNIRRRVDNQ